MQQMFNDMVRQGQPVPGEQDTYLQELVQAYPYCQPAQMLYAKVLQDAASPDAGKQMSRAMASAPDRRHFRSLLAGELAPVMPADATKAVAAEEAGAEMAEEETGKEEKTGHAGDAIPGSAEDDRQEAFLRREAQKRKRQQEIINRFLAEEPRITPRRDNIPEGDLSKESLDFKIDTVSETLAEVLLRQGKKEQAILIYNKLSLMFPEKSSYFAKKLQNIKKANN